MRIDALICGSVNAQMTDSERGQRGGLFGNLAQGCIGQAPALLALR